MGQCNCNGGPAPFIPLKKKENKEIKEKGNGDKILNKVHLLILLGILLIIFLLINSDCQ